MSSVIWFLLGAVAMFLALSLVAAVRIVKRNHKVAGPDETNRIGETVVAVLDNGGEKRVIREAD